MNETIDKLKASEVTVVALNLLYDTMNLPLARKTLGVVFAERLSNKWGSEEHVINVAKIAVAQLIERIEQLEGE